MQENRIQRLIQKLRGNGSCSAAAEEMIQKLEKKQEELGEHATDAQMTQAIRECAFGDDESAMALLHKMDHDTVQWKKASIDNPDTEQFLERAEADVIAFFEKHQLHYVRRAPEQAIVIYELPFRTKNINYLVRVILEAEAKACRIDAVYPFSAEKIYEYPLCRAIAKENFRYRYGALQYDERDGEISFRYSYSISHGVYEDELGRSFECVLRSAENSYAVVQKNCVGKYKRNEAKEMLNELNALVGDLNEMND